MPAARASSRPVQGCPGSACMRPSTAPMDGSRRAPSQPAPAGSSAAQPRSAWMRITSTRRETSSSVPGPGCRTLLVAGVATEVIVQHSALSGAALGLNVQVVVDACGGISARTEEAAFRRLAQAGVALTSVASIAGELAGDLAQPTGRQALGIVFEMASESHPGGTA